MEKANKFTRKVTKTIFIALLMLSGFSLLIFHANFFLLVFAGIFFSVLLNYTSNWIVSKTPLKYGVALFLVLLFITGILCLIFVSIGPSMLQQVEDMSDTLPRSLKILEIKLSKPPWEETYLKNFLLILVLC